MKLRLAAAFLVLMVTNLKTQGGLVNIIATVKLPEEDVKSLDLSPEEENPYFKILNELDDEIYIGGKRLVVIYNKTGDINESKRIRFQNGELTSTITCQDINANQADKDQLCQHYIRVAEMVKNGSTPQFLFCGTNLLEPFCHYFNVSDGVFQSVGNYSARGQVQYSVVQNSTALFYGDSLFTGYNIESRPNPSHIARYTVASDGLTRVATTDDQNENFVNEPDFVGKPYVDKEFMYFFYRETAVEVVNQGKFVYSRVGRICVDDLGNNAELQTFFKATLNCSLQGAYPFYFNHIQDVIVEKRSTDDDDDVIFHAVFTTTPHGPASSAVCSYRLVDIRKVFETSKFKGKVPGKLPGPVNKPTFVEKFLNCQVNTLNRESRDFQEKNPLMDDLVPNYNPDERTGDSNPPSLYFTGKNFYSIAVDYTDSGNKIYYVGTEDGTILKAYFTGDILKTYQMEILKMNRPVTGLHYSNGKLLAVTEQGLYQINLANCASGCPRECREFRYGYCKNASSSCIPAGGDMSSAINYTAINVQILSLNSNEIMSCRNRKVELTCEVKKTSLCDEVELFWLYRDGNRKIVPLVNCSRDVCEGEDSTIAPFVQYQVISNQPHYKLVHLTVSVFQFETDTTFFCSADEKGDTMKEVKISHDTSDGCLTKGSYDKRKEKRNLLQLENTELTSNCEKVNSTQILFQECEKCPGDPKVKAINHGTT